MKSSDTYTALAGPIGRAAPGRQDAWPPTAALLTLISASCARAIVLRAWKRHSDPRTFRGRRLVARTALPERRTPLR